MYLWEGGRPGKEKVRGCKGAGAAHVVAGSGSRKNWIRFRFRLCPTHLRGPRSPSQAPAPKGYKTSPNTSSPAAMWSVGEEVFYI